MVVSAIELLDWAFLQRFIIFGLSQYHVLGESTRKQRPRFCKTLNVMPGANLGVKLDTFMSIFFPE